MSSIAVIDIGNTSLKFARASSGKCGSVTALPHEGLNPRRLTKALKSIMTAEALDGAIACCVAPDHVGRVRDAWRTVSRRPLLFLSHRMKMPITLKYPKPETIGPDRLAAASASYSRMKKAQIVVDAGTAVTVDCVDATGQFLGGAIAPGPAVMSKYLASNTGLLPEIDFTGAVPKIGRSTEGAMRIGVRVGYAALINGIVNHLRCGAFQGARDVPVVITGGYARQLARDIDCPTTIRDNLTLEGLAIIYELNM